MMVAFGWKWTTGSCSATSLAKRAFAVSILFAVVGVSGCKKETKVPPPAAPVVENVYTNRAHDPAYRRLLKQSYSNEMVHASAVRQAVGDMNAYREKVKAALPAGADATVLEQALEKDAEWLNLKQKVEAARIADRQAWEAARANVRAGMEQEARAVQAVKEGRAKAIDEK